MTSFISEACTQAEVLGADNYTRTLYSKTPDIQNLTDYFSRPICLQEGDIPISYRDRIADVSFNNWSGIFDKWTGGTSRMLGVYGARFSMVFTLQVATTPFHQGVLAMSFQYGDYVGTPAYIRSDRSETCTNLPHVRLDLAEDTMVQLKVPFMSHYEYVSSLNNFQYGRMAFNSILPVPTATGLPTATWQIFMHLEDLELYGATPQETVSITLQGGKRLSPVAEEFEQEAFPFSSATMALSRTVRWISKGVPAVSSIAGPASWFLEKAAGTIRSFGFSKPTVVEPVMRTFPMFGVNEQNVDVAAPYSVVGPIASNSLAVTPLFGGTDTDEMALKYVTSQWSQVRYGFMLDTDAARSVLWATNVTPANMWFRSSGVLPFCNVRPPTVSSISTNSFQPSSLFFASSLFKYWRGSIRFRFTFAKTKMHGGRVMVVYNPAVNSNNETNAFSDTANVTAIAAYGGAGPNPFGYSAVFNLRDSNVFEFEVPYVCPVPYLPFGASTGSLAMYIVDKLQAPSMVASSVGFLVEVCGGDDFELANPIGPRYPAHCKGTTLQSGKWLSNAPDEIDQYTIGEKINSFKQLIAMPKSTLLLDNAIDSINSDIQPWYYQPVPSVFVPSTTQHLTESFGYGGNIATCYAYAKGGTDFHCYIGNLGDSTGSPDARIAVVQNPVAMSLSTSTRSPACGSQSSLSLVQAGTGAMHVRLPAYQRYSRMLSHIVNDVLPSGQAWGIKGVTELTSFNSTFNSLRPSALYRVFAECGPGNVAITVSRSASDDAALAHYMGPPPLKLLASNDVGLYDPDSFFFSAN